MKTYSFLARNYRKFPSDEYSYIVADEAHHAVAPTYKRVIQYFLPDFLIGLTATDQRPDKKNLNKFLEPIKLSFLFPRR
ncbi:DEAD/DEAH box helicase family protein [Treponema peruense]|uniref:DEAD/DEAH box helicase family protein n=1 Tax=Treponema peruense TaxID=2787628 RepID=UPI0038B5CCCA